ncbi:MAG: phage baseplate protein [Candidatus Obscuribacterales bacterium]|jgi:hypothetical protein
MLPIPAVSQLAGVPSLPRNGIPLPAPGRILTTILNFILSTEPEVWGIFDEGGNKALEPDTFLEFGFNGAATVSKFPVQDGAFADYNKVQHPNDIVVYLAKGGVDFEGRKTFLDAIEAMKRSLTLYTVVTPYATNKQMNLYDYNYRHTSEDGSHIVIAELRFEEIRQVSAAYSLTESSIHSPMDAGAKPPVSQGGVAPATPTSSLSQAAKALGL